MDCFMDNIIKNKVLLEQKSLPKTILTVVYNTGWSYSLLTTGTVQRKFFRNVVSARQSSALFL
jgi:hypothetical protein